MTPIPGYRPLGCWPSQFWFTTVHRYPPASPAPQAGSVRRPFVGRRIADKKTETLSLFPAKGALTCIFISSGGRI